MSITGYMCRTPSPDSVPELINVNAANLQHELTNLARCVQHLEPNLNRIFTLPCFHIIAAGYNQLSGINCIGHRTVGWELGAQNIYRYAGVRANCSQSRVRRRPVSAKQGDLNVGPQRRPTLYSVKANRKVCEQYAVSLDHRKYHSCDGYSFLKKCLGNIASI